MKLSIFTVFLLLMAFQLPAQTTASQSKPIAKDLTVAEFNKMMVAKPGFLLDVRTPAEVEQGAIPKSTNIDIFSDDFEKDINKIDKSKPVYVYCAVGGRSSEAMEMMTKKGFKEVYNLEGGYNAWKKAMVK